jgi:hypothetical protein
MMNYKLVPNGIAAVPNTNGKFAGPVYDILETTTNQIVAEGISGHNSEAKNLCRKLNMGGGFDGNTPSFFLARIPRRAYLNESEDVV